MAAPPLSTLRRIRRTSSKVNRFKKVLDIIKYRWYSCTMSEPLRELSLFTGGGGGLLASVLLGWRTIGAVEIDEWCCERVGQRRDEGHLGEWFPIWNMDIGDFNREVAPSYAGLVDVVSAGFPCQPFSVAGQQRAADDERNMWPATIECIRVVRPRYCFLENVPGLLAGHGYFATILGDLAESGYDARWRVLSAAEVGAPHKRDRLWVLAYTPSNLRRASGNNGPEALAGRGYEAPYSKHAQTANNPEPHSKRLGWKWCSQDDTKSCRGRDLWAVEPDVGRVVDGLAPDVDRLTALGNGQVPAVAATAWRLLYGS